jgi:phenylalanyl-tRNA synthetase beta chain
VPVISLNESTTTAASLSSVTVEDAALCPRYLGRVLLEVKVGESPQWLKQRLMAAGQRPINNIVDITNFVLLETGQPLHAFDLDKLSGQRIVVRRAGAGEKITTLDTQERTLTGEMLVIADAERSQCVAGVMGGAHSEVDTGTKRIFLESAYFAPASVRKTSRALNLISESSQRFQRGADPEMARYAIDRAAQLIQEIAGAEVCAGVLESYPAPFVQKEITLRYARVDLMLGTVVHREDVHGYLTRLGFEMIAHDAATITVRVPLRRHDVSGEADLIEDILRLHGFDNVPAKLPRIAQPEHILMPQEATVRHLRRHLASAGLTEVYHWTFSNASDVSKAELGAAYEKMVVLQNPLSETHATMRSSLLPGLLNNIVHNISHGVKSLATFEIGPVFFAVDGADLPVQQERLAIALTGNFEEASWNQPARSTDFYDLKGILEEVFGWFRAEVTWGAGEWGVFTPGQAVEISMGGAVVGRCGRVKSAVLKSYDIPQDVFLAELDLGALLALPAVYPRFAELPPFPPSLRDLAIIVNRDVPVGELLSVAREAGGKLLADARVFDVYTGQQVPDGKKSVALSMVYQSPERTLTDKDTQKAHDKILRAIESKFQAQLR